MQTIAGTQFFQLSNSRIISSVNTNFQALRTATYPFTFRLLGVRVQYPSDSFSRNNSLGIQLLALKSLQSQLRTSYTRLTARTNLTALTQLATRIVPIQITQASL